MKLSLSTSTGKDIIIAYFATDFCGTVQHTVFSYCVSILFLHSNFSKCKFKQNAYHDLVGKYKDQLAAACGIDGHIFCYFSFEVLELTVDSDIELLLFRTFCYLSISFLVQCLSCYSRSVLYTMDVVNLLSYL
jgi:hypothetical protein